MAEETSDVATMSSEDVTVEEEISVTAKVPEEYEEILAEYEAEFMHRYTEKDPNFQSYLSKDLDPPPIVENFYSGPPNRGGDRRNRPYQQGHKRRYDGRSYDRNYDRRQQHNQYNRQYDRQYDRHYDRQYNRPYNRHPRGYHQPNYDDRRQPNYQRRGGRGGGWT